MEEFAMTQLTYKERAAQKNDMRSFYEQGKSLYQLSGDSRRVECRWFTPARSCGMVVR